MITVVKAKQLIKENSNPAKVELLALKEAYGFVLSDQVFAILDTPPFNQSAMDGYAFSFADWDGKNKLNLIGEIQAGNYSKNVLNKWEVVRIYTGAALPIGADTVVMQEKVDVRDNQVIIQDEQLAKGSNVRLQGSQTKKGDVALPQGQWLTPACISYLAGIGVSKVAVFSKPAVNIIVTGKELVQPGNPVSEGKIYESNSFGLSAALNQLGICPLSIQVVDDEEEEIRNSIAKLLNTDILILTGGVSVGEYDYVVSALEKCGVKKIFHKVKQKPGKPIYFGKYNQTLVFALPGNPAAVLSCFYEYVVPAITAYTKREYFKKLKLPLAADFKKKPGLTFFLKGKTNDKEVTILDHQESYLMNSFALADCLVELEEEQEYFKKGDWVNIGMII